MSALTRSRSAPTSADTVAAASLLSLLAPLWVLALGQAAGESLRIGEIAPDLVVLAVAACSWTRPGFSAVAFAVLMGCCADVTSGVPWGLAGARLGFMAALYSSLRQGLATEVPGADVFMLVTFVVVERLAHVLTISLWIPGLDLSAALGKAMWISLYTAILTPFALVIARALVGQTAGRRRR